MKAQRSATIGLITIICGFFLWQKVDAIASTKTGAGDKPVKDVVINSVTVA